MSDCAKEECRVPGCGRPVRALSLCSAHYLRVYRTGTPMEDKPLAAKRRRFWKMPEGSVCKVPECGLPEKCQGYCMSHARRKYRNPQVLDTPLGFFRWKPARQQAYMKRNGL